MLSDVSLAPPRLDALALAGHYAADFGEESLMLHVNGLCSLRSGGPVEPAVRGAWWIWTCEERATRDVFVEIFFFKGLASPRRRSYRALSGHTLVSADGADVFMRVDTLTGPRR
jgi:hypothetical protein